LNRKSRFHFLDSGFQELTKKLYLALVLLLCLL
jgi:hypothetical protein